ncbi:MAG TPA: sensor histidine kinase [Gaiellaceae bacterium]
MNVTPRAAARVGLFLDLAIVFAVLAITAVNVWWYDTVAGPRWLTAALPLLLALPLAFRRTRPLLVCVLVLSAIVLQALVSGDSAEGFQLILAAGVAAYSVAAFSERRNALMGLLALAVGYAIYAAEDHNIQSGRTGELWAGAFFGVGLLAAWLIGVFVHSTRERAVLHARAADYERATAEAIAEERSRLARDLHDIVSHNLSVVVAQAGGARAQGPGATDSALEKIERSSREALVEMRRLLGVLRERDDDSPVSPQPGIRQIAALATTMQAAGLSVELDAPSDHGCLSPALELSVYRIVQEALTNTLRHANATQAVVRIHREHDAVTVEVLDNGTGISNGDGASMGHGLVGMRERVDHFGGVLRAAPRPEGGFAVRATLPVTT